MDALEQVLRDLTDACGLDAYLMYGCLLGAIRDGHMIGHDSDADVAYLSKYDHPFDIIRECTAATRQMRALGWKVVRMSGANFKVWVPLPDGRRCGIDVFGSFHIGERFYVTGSLTGTLDRSALLPFGTVTLEGREIVAPARPEEVLAFTYGPTWRVPDPAFHFDHDPVDVRRMDAWFRSSRRRLRFWGDFYKSPDAAKVPTEPSLFARLGAAAARRAAGGRRRGARRRRRHRSRLDLLRASRATRSTALDYTHAGPAPRPPERSGSAASTSTIRLPQPRGPPVGAADRRPARPPGRAPARSTPAVCSTRWATAAATTSGGSPRWCSAAAARPSWSSAPRGPAASRSTSARTSAPTCGPTPSVREIEAAGGHVVHREIGRDLAPLGRREPSDLSTRREVDTMSNPT